MGQFSFYLAQDSYGLPYGPVFVVSWSGQLDCLKGQFSLYRAQDNYGLLYGPVSVAVVGRLDSLKQPHKVSASEPPRNVAII